MNLHSILAGEAIPFEIPTSRWNDAAAAAMGEPELLLYRSNLLGSDLTITNFGGGNTSAKICQTDPLTGEAVSNTIALARPVRPDLPIEHAAVFRPQAHLGERLADIDDNSETFAQLHPSRACHCAFMIVA